MDWLLQNWIWIALAVGAVFFMARMGGCGMGHSTGHSHGSSSDNPPADPGAGVGTSFDPVSHHAVTAGSVGISSVYHGRAYYFENRENRDAFEGNPEKYLAGAPAVGEPVGSARDDDHRHHRRHGC